VQHGKDDVGYVQALFVSMHDHNQGPLCFRLGGRAWQVGQVDWSKGVLHVRPAENGRVPNWLGLPGMLSAKLCQTMMEVLLQEGAEEAWLSGPAQKELAGLRESYAGVLEEGTAPLEQQLDGVVWHTFAGGAVNRLLAAGLEAKTAKRWVAGNLSLRCKDLPLSAARDGVIGLAQLDWERVAAQAARSMARGMVSKFQPCLPQEAEDRLLAERLVVLGGTLRFLGTTKLGGVGEASRPFGARVADAEATAAFPIDVSAVPVAGEVAQPRNEIVWVDTPAALRMVAEELLGESALGLDVETALDFGTLCLIQLATERQTYLIDPFAVGELTPLAPVLGAERPVKVIHNGRFERRVLARVGIELSGVFDTLEASRRRRGREVMGGHSLAMVCERELGVRLDKGAQTSNWGRRPLSAEQVAYAAVDAEVLLGLHGK